MILSKGIAQCLITMYLLHVNYTLLIMVVVVVIIITSTVVPSKNKEEWHLLAMAFTEPFNVLKSLIRTSVVM